MLNIDEFNNQVMNVDFQRTNLFSCVFATSPSAKSQLLLDQFGGMLYNNLPIAGDWLGLSQGEFTQGITSIITAGTQEIVRKSGVSKYLLGAMTNRVVQSLLGEFEVGTYLLDFFNMAFPQSGLMIYSVKLPENRLSHETDWLHNSPNIRITGRELEPLTLSFRMDSEAANWRAMQDWVNSVQDPVTGLRALPVDVEADIQVNLHARNGLPHTVAMFTGCIPVSCGSPEFTWDGDNQIAVFDVQFAYRVMQTGAVGRQAAADWVEDRLIGAIGNISGEFGLDASLAQLSRLGGAAGGITQMGNAIGRKTGLWSSTSKILGM